MKIWIVVQGELDEGYAIKGVHQVEAFAEEQVDKLMSCGEWERIVGVRFDDDGPDRAWHWERGRDFVELQEWELSY